MRVFRLVSYPATLMLIVAAAYTMVRVNPSERASVFAMLSLTAVGATELVQAAVRLISRERFGSAGAASLVTGTGALVMGFAILDGLATIPFVIGSLLYGGGLLVRIRRQLARQ